MYLRTIAIILVLLSFCGCAAAPAASSADFSSAPEYSEELYEEPISEPVPEEPSVITFEAEAGLTPQETVEIYFEQLYNSYVFMKPIDLSPIADFEKNRMMKNLETWNSLLALRRKLIFEHDFCFVETEKKDYTINYIEEKSLSDQRMDYIDLSDYGEGALALHFIIKGSSSEAYPPLFAVNSEHTVVLSFDGESYKIAYHYFPGSEGKFENDLDVEMISETKMLATLVMEFAEISVSEEKPLYSRIYDPEAAVSYALTYCEEPNPAFYFVGDWYGNCMNFVSQSIWSGFAADGDTPKNYGAMTDDWYCGKIGGTLIWASVSRFWNWTQDENCDMQVTTFGYVYSAKIGDIVNLASRFSEERGKFSHALIVVDDEKLILAQNSPACFIYYSDIVGCDFRFLRPVSLNA